MINYRTHATIKVGCKVVKEYFNIVNIEYYAAILGTPFLRKLGIILDFWSPGIMQWYQLEKYQSNPAGFTALSGKLDAIQHLKLQAKEMCEDEKEHTKEMSFFFIDIFIY